MNLKANTLTESELNSKIEDALTESKKLGNLSAQKIYSHVDLTTLDITDRAKTILEMGKMATFEENHVAAICVYPKQIENVKKLNLPCKLASVAGGFPSSQLPLELKLSEIKWCIDQGADEIDFVISFDEYLNNELEALKREVLEITSLCIKNNVQTKAILETGLIESNLDIYSLSKLMIESGVDFVKTSTGKNSDGATLEAVAAMSLAISKSEKGFSKCGVKASGGIKDLETANLYYNLVRYISEQDELNPRQFRIGASSLVKNLIKDF